MSLLDDLRDRARDLLIAVSGATDGKVINAGAKGPAPTMPYVTVRLTTIGGNEHGPAARLDGLNGATPTATMVERREAVVSYQGYGTGSYAWLEDLQARLDSPTSLAQQETDGIAAVLATPVRDLSALLDTAEQTRCMLELRIRYENRTAAVDQTELLQTEVDLTGERYDGDPDTLTLDFALDADGDLTTPT